MGYLILITPSKPLKTAPHTLCFVPVSLRDAVIYLQLIKSKTNLQHAELNSNSLQSIQVTMGIQMWVIFYTRMCRTSYTINRHSPRSTKNKTLSMAGFELGTSSKRIRHVTGVLFYSVLKSSVLCLHALSVHHSWYPQIQMCLEQACPTRRPWCTFLAP
jgi:hypothetical protein